MEVLKIVKMQIPDNDNVAETNVSPILVEGQLTPEQGEEWQKIFAGEDSQLVKKSQET